MAQRGSINDIPEISARACSIVDAELDRSEFAFRVPIGNALFSEKLSLRARTKVSRKKKNAPDDDVSLPSGLHEGRADEEIRDCKTSADLCNHEDDNVESVCFRMVLARLQMI